MKRICIIFTDNQSACEAVFVLLSCGYKVSKVANKLKYYFDSDKPDFVKNVFAVGKYFHGNVEVVSSVEFAERMDYTNDCIRNHHPLMAFELGQRKLRKILNEQSKQTKSVQSI